MPKTMAEPSDNATQARRTRCRGCETSWTGLKIAHCSACHRTFTTPTNFDKHRAGDKAKRWPAGECHDPTLNGLVQNDRGQWSAPGRAA